jgi:hypothetical protein
MSWGVVKMQLPVVYVPQLRSLAPNSTTKMTKNFLVVLQIDSLASWCILMMHNTMIMEKQSISYLHRSETVVLFWASGILDASIVTTGIWFPDSYAYTHDSSP